MRINDIKQHQWLGIPEVPEKRILLKAGKLEAEFCSGRLINFVYGGKTVLSEVYFALRDQNWNTIPYLIEKLKISENEEGFEVSFHARHDLEGICYEWEGRITGNSGCEISYSFRGRSGSAFLRNRIGFCVLHPAECAGKQCRIIHSNGETEEGVFPERIAPHQPFLEIKELVYDSDGVKVSTGFDGDIFEMEDQRNWTDASFKTYCTPLREPFPVKVHAGDEAFQKITVKAEAGGGGEKSGPAEDILDIERMESRGKIRLGSVIKAPLNSFQAEMIRRLKPDHLRYEYYFSADNSAFPLIMDQIRELETGLILAVFFTDDWEKEVKTVQSLIDGQQRWIRGIMVFQERTKVISADILKQVRDILKPAGIAVGSGTDAFFTQNNREPLPAELMDFVSYSNNPQVHAFDNDSMMATTDGQAANVLSCRKLFQELPVMVSPVSLKMRWNPDLTAEEKQPDGVRPKNIDPRQMSLFAASWFLRSFISLTEAGAYGADYFELTGPAGIMQSHELPDYDFPAWPDMVYPIYIAMYFLAGADAKEIRTVKMDDYAAVCLKETNRTRIIMANSRDRDIEITVRGLPEKISIFSINGANVKDCMENVSEIFEESALKRCSFKGQIRLSAYEIIVMDV